MWEFSIFRALGLMIRTWPFVLMRVAIHLGIALGLVVAAGAGAVAGQALADLSGEVSGSSAALWGGGAGFLFAALAVVFLRGRLLHQVTAPHLAALVETLDRRPLPIGRGQVGLANGIVAQRFGDAPALIALDALVRGVIRTATGMVDGLLVDILPVSALDRLVRGSGAQLRLTLGLLDGVVLAHATRTRSENAWEAAHDGLVLYTQNARPLMANAVWLALVGWALAGLVAFAALSPTSPLAALLPGGPWAGVLLALVLGWAVKAALYDPFALACMLQLHLRLTQDQEPLPEWRGRLTQVSDTFRQLGERALGWRSGAAQDA
ncbi:MAG: hypothetical protein U1E69_02690 [Tabrizicola sp.]|uniref:hypothetical protein n=1 Tax=Tabrizicola sp. TaxID=2005166 RepID=UPI002ABBD44B|nr:hypothetical protein [Tabrizicola sp.]MDZ4085689.1 hypothetical protein [Tabrizicola sp.]